MEQLHKENISLCMKIIFHFLKTTGITSVTSGHNVLFIEGPINDYKEEAIQVIGGGTGPVLAGPLLQRVSIILRQTKCQ